MNKFWKTILPDVSRDTDIEVRLFEITLFVTVLILVFWSVYGLFAGYGMTVEGVYFIGMITYLVMYVLLKRKYNFNLLTAFYYCIGLVLFCIAWLPSGGISGAITSFLVLLYISGLLVLPIRGFVIFIISTFLIVLAFSTYELFYPDAAPSYSTREFLITDLMVANVIMLLITGICILIFKRAYLRDRQTLEARNEELEAEKLKAQAADRSKTAFLTTISHEMRTPLNGIVGLTELLADTNLNADQRVLLRDLKYSSHLLHTLISDVLDITAIEAGKIQLHMATVDFHAEVFSLWQVFQSKLDSEMKTLELFMDWDAELPRYVECDFFRIRQVLINLLNNAAKYTLAGRIDMKVDLIEQHEQQFTAKFTISDTGLGIPMDKQESLFQRFYKATENNSIEGSGLGLSISKNLVELMQGTIGFNSIEGGGSQFYFELPLISSSADKLTGEHTLTNNHEHLKSMSILLVEDVRINQIVAEKLLKNLGIEQLEIASNGEIALEMAQNSFYDVILMDLQMPVMGGVESAQRINEHYKNSLKKPVILALTANVLKEDREACYEAGMKDFIVKPFNSAILIDILNRWVNVPK